jgi:hypothetical protein
MKRKYILLITLLAIIASVLILRMPQAEVKTLSIPNITVGVIIPALLYFLYKEVHFNQEEEKLDKWFNTEG